MSIRRNRHLGSERDDIPLASGPTSVREGRRPLCMRRPCRRVFNRCADLLSERRYECFLRGLFGRPKGEWVGAAALCANTRTHLPSDEALPADLYVTWLDEPTGTEGFVTVVFFLQNDHRSMAAVYNRRYLLASSPGPKAMN
jgi:hypothetical protein